MPKPPLAKPMIKNVVEYLRRDDDTGHWIDVRVDRVAQPPIGPFAWAAERNAAYDDLLSMLRAAGAVDLSNKFQ